MTDPALARPVDVPVLRGDPGRLHAGHRVGAGDRPRRDPGRRPRLLARPHRPDRGGHGGRAQAGRRADARAARARATGPGPGHPAGRRGPSAGSWCGQAAGGPEPARRPARLGRLLRGPAAPSRGPAPGQLLPRSSTRGSSRRTAGQGVHARRRRGGPGPASAHLLAARSLTVARGRCRPAWSLGSTPLHLGPLQAQHARGRRPRRRRPGAVLGDLVGNVAQPRASGILSGRSAERPAGLRATVACSVPPVHVPAPGGPGVLSTVYRR